MADPKAENPEVLLRRIDRERRVRIAAEEIAERTTAELYSVTERQRAILEAAGDAILATDVTSAVTLVNPAAVRALGTSPAELQGKSLHEALHHPPAMDAPCTPERCGLLATIQTDTPAIHAETIVVRRDSTRFPAEFTLTPIAQAGNRAGLVLTLRDVTARRQAEATRIQMAAQVDQMRRLQEIDAFRTNFINMAAHELRTPLTPIRTELYLLRQAKDTMSEEQQRSFEILNRSFDRLGRLVEEVLEGARMQAGKLGMRREPMDLGRVARDAVDSFRNTLAQHGIVLEDRIEPSIPILGDAGRLVQVMTNLLGNAAKFTPRGGRITVSAKRASDLGTVSVRDTGVGLDDTDMARLFRPFSQTSAHASAIQEGAGLGLYICKGIVEMHGGRIWAESQGRGKGTTFTFALPVGDPASRAPTTQPSAQPGGPANA